MKKPKKKVSQKRKKKAMKVGILTGGGDCPGLNAVIRAVAKKIILETGENLVGFLDGYDGLINNNYRKLGFRDASGILNLGGTILGTSNIANPYRYAYKEKGKLKFKDVSKQTIRNVKKLGIDCLVCIGGDGTLFIANQLYKDGIPVVGVPKTIDNDIRGTDKTFGFDTAVWLATGGIDRIHTTAQAHHRVMIVEVMGRTAGWIALYSGVAGGGDIILIPEIPYQMDKIIETIKQRHKRGTKFSIIVVAEGAKPKGGDVVIRQIVAESPIAARLGGIGFVLASEIEKRTDIETRAVVMGHLLRGGSPSPSDRVLATELGTKVVDMIKSKKFGHMVGVKGNDYVPVPLKTVAQGARLVPKNHRLIKSARSIGIGFGD